MTDVLPDDASPARPTRWRRGLHGLLGLTALVGLCAFATRALGRLSFARALEQVEPLLPRPDESAPTFAEAEDATLLLAELEELERSGRIDLTAPAGPGTVVDAQAALRAVLDTEVPTPEAARAFEPHLAGLEPALALVERMQARPHWGLVAPGPGRQLLTLRFRGLDALLRWVGAAAVHAARVGDLALAERRLRQAFHLSSAAREVPSLAGFHVFASQRAMAFEALAAALHHRPDAFDTAWLGTLLAEDDLRARHARALAADFYAYVEHYRAEELDEALQLALLVAATTRASAGNELPRADDLRLHALLGGHDAAHFVERAAALQALTQRSLAEALRGSEDPRNQLPAPWYAPTAPYFAGQLALGLPAWLELESHLVLARVVLADRSGGRAAALELLERTLDPGDDQSVGQRAEEDGTRTLWCVGPDLLDLGGSATEGDIVWSLPARR